MSLETSEGESNPLQQKGTDGDGRASLRDRFPPDGSLSHAMTALVACLSPYSEETVRAMLKGRHEVDIVFVPDPPAQQAVLDATHAAHLVIADKRHLHRIDRRVLENMRNCLLIQQAAVGFDSIDHRAAAEYGIPVANAAGYNREAVADWTVLAISTCSATAPGATARCTPAGGGARR